jgi:hypothetical protein
MPGGFVFLEIPPSTVFGLCFGSIPIQSLNFQKKVKDECKDEMDRVS